MKQFYFLNNAFIWRRVNKEYESVLTYIFSYFYVLNTKKNFVFWRIFVRGLSKDFSAMKKLWKFYFCIGVRDKKSSPVITDEKMEIITKMKKFHESRLSTAWQFYIHEHFKLKSNENRGYEVLSLGYEAFSLGHEALSLLVLFILFSESWSLSTDFRNRKTWSYCACIFFIKSIRVCKSVWKCV